MTGRIVFLVLQFLSMKICQRTSHFLKCGCKGMAFFDTHQIFLQVFSKKSEINPKFSPISHFSGPYSMLCSIKTAFFALSQQALLYIILIRFARGKTTLNLIMSRRFLFRKHRKTRKNPKNLVCGYLKKTKKT